ncbi:PREDICTED: C2 domain-containing protein 2 [Gekko japonicus]|uniref:C2 domain-containing protein 2 n=1 Tax=Gekko japonicus TaxID=146911 RepID=A0ABM1K6B1_GEKJA|nr:PREDICTED: C2 domain-containing protein 2 [Gekko japonicus]
MAWLLYWLGEIRWLSLLSLFVAAVVIVAVYLVQYGLSTLGRRGETPPPAPLSELLQGDEDALFAWLLSLNSWRREWQKAWITALNWEAKLREEDSRIFTFEEDAASQPLELVVQRVVSVIKSPEEKVVSCNIAGNAIQFIVNVIHPSLAPAECRSYRVKLSPFHLQLELSMKAREEDIQVKWSFIHTSETNTEVKPIILQQVQTDGNTTASKKLKGILQNLINSASPSMILSTKSTDVKAIQNVQNTGTLPQGTSPPKPPRAHELKLLMKNIKATLASQSTESSINPVCIVQLNDPLQKFCGSVANNSTDLSWKEEFIFELNAKSKDLQIKVFENGEMDSGFSALATVPLDLFRKQPSGQKSFTLNCNLNSNSPSVGFVSADFSYIEPSESRHLKVPATLAKVEKDRTVMPCGTVVTTVTSVKAKPLIEGRSSALHSDSPARSPVKMKVIEKDLSIQAIQCRKASVSKALSSSDTELLVLNGTDPVAEVAIRQLSESAKQKLKSPRKKSTIIISGVSKTNLSQDCEAALMMDYAAAMDGSYVQNDTTALKESVAQSPPDEELSLSASQTLPSHEDTQENSHDAWTLDDSSQQWQSNALLDHDCDKVSESSISISESGTVKKSKGGIFKKGARLFFLRRHHQKDPGMSQSHNDLIYLQQPTSDGTRRKGGTLTRILNKKILYKSKSKNKLNGTSVEPCT